MIIVNNGKIKQIKQKESGEKSKIVLGSLGQQLAQEKLKSMQKDMQIETMGQELAKLKLEIIQMKGGMQ